MNLKRLFYKPEHCGLKKTEAAKTILNDINPDVEIELYDIDITRLEGFDIFLTALNSSAIGKEGKPVDLVLSCVDNFEARFTVNQACLELDLPWMESGVSEDAMSSHIQFLIPGLTACFDCAPPLITASGIPESTLKREGVCAASLPTTMTITASLLVQNALKFLLKFGIVTFYQGYIALNDYFPNQSIKPNKECTNSWCRKRQEEYKTKEVPNFNYMPKEEIIDLHPENPYNIVIEDSTNFTYQAPLSSSYTNEVDVVTQEDKTSGIDKIKMLQEQLKETIEK